MDPLSEPISSDTDAVDTENGENLQEEDDDFMNENSNDSRPGFLSALGLHPAGKNGVSARQTPEKKSSSLLYNRRGTVSFPLAMLYLFECNVLQNADCKIIPYFIVFSRRKKINRGSNRNDFPFVSLDVMRANYFWERWFEKSWITLKLIKMCLFMLNLVLHSLFSAAADTEEESPIFR